MNRSTRRSRVASGAYSDDQVPRASPANQDRPQPAPDFPDPIQGRLPVKPDAKRGCDRIRARAFRDSRLRGLALNVVLAVSEFVRSDHPIARLKLATIAKWAHADRKHCGLALHRVEAAGVWEIDRKSHHQRIVFLDSWLRWFGGEWGRQRRDETSDHPVERCDETSHHDVTKGHITGEPVLGEPAEVSADGCC